MNNYYVTTYDTLNCVWVEVEVTEEVYRAYKKTEWDIENNERSSKKFETPFSGLRIPEEGMDKKELFADYGTDLVDIVEKRMKLEMLKTAFEMLDKDDQKTIFALFFQEKSQREYAKEIGMSKSGIQYRQKKAIKNLKRNFKK